MFTAPDNLRIDNFTLFRYARMSGLDLLTYALFYGTPDRQAERCGVGAGCAVLGTDGTAFAPANQVGGQDLDLPRLGAALVCSAGACEPSQVPSFFVVFSARIGLADVRPPTFVRDPTGPLSDAGRVLSGEQDLRFAAADLGGGLAHVALLVDGVMQKEQPITPAGSGCREPYVEPVPCPLTNDGGISFDTASVADGPHSVALALIDAAGNRTVSRAVSVVFRNRPLANGVGATRAAKLRTWFRVNGRSRASRTVSFGKRARLHGTLETAAGAPIAGAVIEVSTTPRELGAGGRELASITTDERGRFAFTPVAGSSRRITLAYRPFDSDPTPATTAAVILSVRAGVTLRVTPRRTTSRGRIAFSGRLLGGPNRKGTQVQLFAVARRGRDRVPVATLRADSRGRFRFSYRFRRTFAPFTYYFQAVVSRQNGYPYATGRSRRVSVRIVR